MFTGLTLLALNPGYCAEVNAWDQDSFQGYGRMDGVDGWRSGFDDDRWWTDGDDAYSDADYNNDDTYWLSGYGSGWAADNWLIREGMPQVGQGGVEVNYRNEDDDTIGLVFGHRGSNTFYLAGTSSDNAPPPFGFENSSRVFLIRVDNGDATSLGRVDADLGGLRHVLKAQRDGTLLTVWLDGTPVIQAEDTTPLEAGNAGFYAYDSGWDGGGNATEAWFDDIRVYWLDEDDDGVVDDEDNCESVANADQADTDNDGTGDACEGATDEPTDSDPSNTDTLDTGGSANPLVQEGLKISSACACQSSGTPGGLGLGLALALVVLGRRRTQVTPTA
jgi:uncharacterized protein (TIGR03382 family)